MYGPGKGGKLNVLPVLDEDEGEDHCVAGLYDAARVRCSITPPYRGRDVLDV